MGFRGTKQHENLLVDHSQTHRLKLTGSMVGIGESSAPGTVRRQLGSEPNILLAASDKVDQQPTAVRQTPFRPLTAYRQEARPETPYHINIMLKNYGETCFRCKKKIQIFSEHKPNNSEHEKYCRGCQLNPEDPMGISLDLRKVCFTVDWTRDFTYAMPETLTEDETYRE